jgi:ABC-2 type transport system permease protein
VSPVLTVAGVELRRFLRDRSNVFFVFLFPLLLVLVLGAQFGGSSSARVAVAGPEAALRDALVHALEADEVTVTIADPEAVREHVARGRADVGLLVTAQAGLAFASGENARVQVVPGSRQGAQAGVQRVRTAASRVSADQRQLATLSWAGVPKDAAQAALERAASSVRVPTLRVVNEDSLSQEFAGLGQFDLQAVGQTLLFVFLASLAGSATLIKSRRLGVVSRTLAAPVSTVTVVGGQALGRFAIAGFQGVYIVVATLLLFGVYWGSLWLSLLVLAAFSAVAAGGAMVLGSALDNEGTASGVGVGLGLVFAALGGCMLPLELFPDTLRTVAHITPHAWAYEAFAEIQRHDAALPDVLPQLAVLAAMAAALLTAGTWTLRHSLSRAL